MNVGNNEEQTQKTSRITCRLCRHYYITWDANFPYGCKALAFKSKTLPADMVRSASDMDCQLFKAKKTPSS